MYLLDPIKLFADIAKNPVTNHLKENVIGEFKVTFKKHNVATFTHKQGSMDIHERLYEQAQEAGDYIKIDYTRERARRVSVDEAYKQIVEKVEKVAAKEFDPTKVDIVTTKLKDVEFNPKLFKPIKTGTYLDGYFSRKGGILPGINIMVTGDPGIGKSSNLMDILINVAQHDKKRKVLYISAEMSEIDVKEFEKYYPGVGDIDFLYLNNYIINDEQEIKPYQALQSVLHQGWDLIVLDSLIEIQAAIQEDLDLNGKEAEKWMLNIMGKHNQGHNKTETYSSFLCIQQMNKSGQFAGSNRLMHMTTAFLQLCWSKKEHGKRYMIFEKNRKGQEKVPLFYAFSEEKGIVYDEQRHQKELEIFKRLATQIEVGLGEFDLNEFEKLLASKVEEAPAIS